MAWAVRTAQPLPGLNLFYRVVCLPLDLFDGEIIDQVGGFFLQPLDEFGGAIGLAEWAPWPSVVSGLLHPAAEVGGIWIPVVIAPVFHVVAGDLGNCVLDLPFPVVLDLLEPVEFLE